MNRLVPAQPTAYDPAPHARTLAAASGCDGLIDISIVRIALPTIRDDVDANAVALPVFMLFAPQQARYGRRHDSRLVPPVFFRKGTFTGALAAHTSLLSRRRLLPLALPVAADTPAGCGVRGSGAALPGMAEIGSPHPREIGSRPGPMALRSVANSDPLLRRSVIRPRSGQADNGGHRAGSRTDGHLRRSAAISRLRPAPGTGGCHWLAPCCRTTGDL